MISACAASSPFPPRLPLPLSYHPRCRPPSSLSVSLLLAAYRPSLPVRLLSPVVLLISRRPSRRSCVSLSLPVDFPSLPPRSDPPPRLAPSLSVPPPPPAFSPFSFLALVGQFHPLPPIRRAHCSRVSRIAEVKPSDDFLAGTWFRARCFFPLSVSVSVCLSLSRPSPPPFSPSPSFSRPLSLYFPPSSRWLLLPMTGRRAYDQWVVTRKGRTTSEVTDVTVNGGGGGAGG